LQKSKPETRSKVREVVAGEDRLVSAQPSTNHCCRRTRFLLQLLRHEPESHHGMFGNPLGDVMSTAKTNSSESSPETLKLVEQVLDYIRANLINIRNTWGAESVQYKSAAEIMDQYLEENMKRLKVKKPDLEGLMKNLSLDQ
jgi:hypothetical protein